MRRGEHGRDRGSNWIALCGGGSDHQRDRESCQYRKRSHRKRPCPYYCHTALDCEQLPHHGLGSRTRDGMVERGTRSVGYPRDEPGIPAIQSLGLAEVCAVAEIDTFLFLHFLLSFMQVKCDREGCGHTWDYTGKSRFKATCPMCRKIVNLKQQQNNTSSSRKE